jgi:hypothetical protein
MNRNPMPAHIIRPQHSNGTLRGMIFSPFADWPARLSPEKNRVISIVFVNAKTGRPVYFRTLFLRL